MPSCPVPAFAEAAFHKASRSEPQGNCVRIARRDGWVAIRDDKTSFGADADHHLVLPATEFDRAIVAWGDGDDGPVQIIDGPGHESLMRLADGSNVDLRFSSAEIDAFLDGVARGEFDGPVRVTRTGWRRR